MNAHEKIEFGRNGRGFCGPFPAQNPMLRATGQNSAED
jgi:hypothetical protein